jgi:hypothetical protein
LAKIGDAATATPRRRRCGGDDAAATTRWRRRGGDDAATTMHLAARCRPNGS